MPKPYPEEFREDVVRVARNRGPGVTVEQVAKDFGVHPMTLWKWMRRADIDDEAKPGITSQESTELREARQRIKLLEQENEVLRRAAALEILWIVLGQWSASDGQEDPGKLLDTAFAAFSTPGAIRWTLRCSSSSSQPNTRATIRQVVRLLERRPAPA
ncbi:transposase [Streptomyces sp. WG7]|uniref:transposase n=1 Tax=Streptomyces sp. WG7 TaxID=3417650 RepID=UPI003CEDA74C